MISHHRPALLWGVLQIIKPVNVKPVNSGGLLYLPERVVVRAKGNSLGQWQRDQWLIQPVWMN